MKSNDNTHDGDQIASTVDSVDQTSNPEEHRFTEDTTAVVTDVVVKLAAVLDQDPMTITPLAHSIDPMILGRLVDTTEQFDLAFDHAGCRVRITRTDSGLDVEVELLADGTG